MADKSPELALLESIQTKMEASGSATTKELTEMKAVIEAQKIIDTELKATVEKLNTELKAKDASFLDIKNEINEIKAKQGRQTQASSEGLPPRLALLKEIQDKIVEHKAAIAETVGGGLIKPIKWENKASVITTSSFTGTNAPYRNYLDWQPGMEPTGQFRFRSMVRTVQSDVDNVSFPRANTPVGAGSFGVQVAETDTKAQIDRGYTMIDVLCDTIAGFALVSRRSLANIRFLQSWLPTSMMEQLEDTEDLRFANALVAAATGSTSTTGITSTAVNTPLVKLVAFMKNLMQTKFNPSMIVCDPNVWANLFLTVETNAGFSLPNVCVVDASGNLRILGRIVQPVNWLTGGRVLVGDWSKAAIVESEGLTMRQSDSHASIFAQNQLAFLLERVEDLAVFRPDAFTTAVV